MDCVHTNIAGAYLIEPCPHVDYSDYIPVILITEYRLLVRRAKPIGKQKKIWPPGAISVLSSGLF